MSRPLPIHLGDAGRAISKCGLVRPASFTWKPESATCKRCIAAYRRKVEAAQKEQSNG